MRVEATERRRLRQGSGPKRSVGKLTVTNTVPSLNPRWWKLSDTEKEKVKLMFAKYVKFVQIQIKRPCKL